MENGYNTFLRNVDLMRQAILRRTPGAPVNPNTLTRFTTVLFDDLDLAPGVATRLRQQSIARCSMMAIQFSYGYTAVAPVGYPWPLVTVRDGQVSPGATILAANGFELIPGDLIVIEPDDFEKENNVFLDPTDYWAFLIATAVPGTTIRMHIAYGVLK